MKLARFVRLSVVLIAAVLGSYPAQTEQSISGAEDGGRKINLANRQRTLLELMGKSACFAVLGIDTENHVRDLVKAHETFDKTLNDLAQGSQPQRLLPETDPNVLTGLKAVTTLSEKYSPVLKLVAEHHQDKTVQEPLKNLYELNLTLLLEMNETVTRIENEYGRLGRAQHAKLSAAIDVAGRQRMLSQKMAKEFCMAVSDYKPEESRAFLLGTTALFNSTQDWLAKEAAYLDLTPTQIDNIFVRKDKIEEIWRSLHEIYSKTAAGGTPTQAELATVAASSRLMLAELNDLVEYYETFYVPQPIRRKLHIRVHPAELGRSGTPNRSGTPSPGGRGLG